jgi:hypothetical protein
MIFLSGFFPIKLHFLDPLGHHQAQFCESTVSLAVLIQNNQSYLIQNYQPYRQSIVNQRSLRFRCYVDKILRKIEKYRS